LTLDRYIGRLVAVPAFAAFALLILLVSAFNAALLLRDAAYSRIPFDYIAKLILLRNITAAEVLLPTALYVAVLATFNQWHRDREAFACYAAGISPRRMSRTVSLLCLVTCLIVAGFSLFARPWAYAASYRLDAAAAELSTDAMQPDRFYTFGDTIVLSAREIDRSASIMRGVFMQNRLSQGVQIVHADTGRMHPPADGQRRLELSHGTIHWLSDGDFEERIAEFETLVYFAPTEPEEGVRSRRRAATTAELAASEGPKEIAELQWRLLLPVTAFFMTLVAIELARALPGSSPYPRFIAGLVTYAAIFNLAAVGRTWVENGQVGALPGMLWVPLVSAAVLLLLRQLPALSLSRPQ